MAKRYRDSNEKSYSYASDLNPNNIGDPNNINSQLNEDEARRRRDDEEQEEREYEAMLGEAGLTKEQAGEHLLQQATQQVASRKSPTSGSTAGVASSKLAFDPKEFVQISSEKNKGISKAERQAETQKRKREEL